MQTNDFQQFKNVICGMARMFGMDADEVILDMYWLALKDWNLEDFKSAAAHLLGTCKFMPKPFDFNELKKAGRATPGEAWSHALAYARDLAERPLDPLVEKAVGMIGGYNAIRMSKTSDTHWLEKRFCEHYETAQDAHETRDALPQIATESVTLRKLLAEMNLPRVD